MAVSKNARPKSGVSEAVVDRAIKVLRLKPKKKYEAVVKKVIWRRLNDIHARFSDPESYRKASPPAKIRNSLRAQHKTIIKTLKILRSLNGDDEATRLLFSVSEVGQVLSAGLVGYDVFLDKNVSTAISALERVEGYYSGGLEKAKSAVKGKGETKAGNPYADNLLGNLCRLYRDITGEPPTAFVNEAIRRLLREELDRNVRKD